MTDQERIYRLEKMVKGLTETLQRVVSTINTGNYEHVLKDIEIELTNVHDFKLSEEKDYT